MGFFSFCCLRCDRPLLSPYSITPGVNDWMSLGVSITPDHHLQRGTYDGYGRLIDPEHGMPDPIGLLRSQAAQGERLSTHAVWHEACWELAGRPTRFQEPSASAPDQGFFFNQGDYDLPDPRSPRDHQDQSDLFPRT